MTAQKPIQPHLGEKNSAAANTARNTAAVSVRVLSMGARPLLPVRRGGLRDPPPAGLRLLDLLAGAPEAALALLVPVDRRVELLGVEVRPELRSEVELGVR